MTRPSVHLVGRDNVGWAIDEDYRLVREALGDRVRLTDLAESEIVHACWSRALDGLADAQLAGKRVVCHMVGEPRRCLSEPSLSVGLERVGLWLARSEQALAQLETMGRRAIKVPYIIDSGVFRPLEAAAVAAARERFGLPDGAYLIGSLQRDSESKDLASPKLVKGPDLFAEILALVQAAGVPVHAVLGGPRRHWLRARLTQLGVPFTFVGRLTDKDDLAVNTLPRTDLNLLYNLFDLCLVASRSEGGPHAVMEAALARCPVLSTTVGIAPDVLAPDCVFARPEQAVERIVRDARERNLTPTVEVNARQVQQACSPEAARESLRQAYETIAELPPFEPTARGQQRAPASRTLWQRATRRLWPARANTGLRVGIWHTFHKPPCGGGGQFMLALCEGLKQRGVTIVANRYSADINVWLLNSTHFDVPGFQRWYDRHPAGVVHRLDGPDQLVRGTDAELDQQCYELNDRLASGTVLQSGWVYEHIVALGYQPVRPSIILNAVNPRCFNATGRRAFRADGKIRLISSSWSNNVRKGGPIYKWIEQHLDWSRYDYTFVGNASEPFERVQHLKAVGSEELAGLLRQHDIYITASSNDPCSNAVVEALACGLPVLYLNDGGHPELVGYGGLPFSGTADVLSQLDRLSGNYALHQALCRPPDFDATVDRYLEMLHAAKR